MPILRDNRDLLDRFRRGDRAALAEVFEAYVDDVATLARRGFTIESQGHVHVAGAGPDAERELVQETFSRAFSARARASYDGVRPYKPFLLRITKNLMIDRHRDRKKAAVDLDAVGDAELAVGGEPEVDLHWKKLSAIAAEVLGELDRESREVIRLRFEDDLSQDEVAGRLGCSRRRVRTVESRVKKRLAKRLRSLGLLDG